MSFIFEQVLTGGDRNFGYLIGDVESKEAALVDPSYRPEVLVQRAQEQGLAVKYIINTHGHGDHTNGNTTARELTGASIAAYKGSYVDPEVELDDQDELTLGGLVLKFFYVPGHIPDHLIVNVPEHRIAITGDHLFVGKVGGTSGKEAAREQYDSLWRMYDVMPEETTTWPGHDVGCRPSSTLALERVSNPFLMVSDFDAFYHLKENWAAYKASHGLI